MSDTTASLRRKMAGAKDLQSVVRTMKAMAASSIGQYEKSVSALSEYYSTLELGLSACFRKSASLPLNGGAKKKNKSVWTGAVVFGSDQGLVGKFNDAIADYAIHGLADLPGKPKVWAVGERVHARLIDAGISVEGVFDVPSSVNAITPLIGRILIQIETLQSESSELRLYYNRPTSSAGYAPVSQRLLPLDEVWRCEVSEKPWPTRQIPEVLGNENSTLAALIRGYLFISLFRGCAESLASENASRLAAMQRAERNIEEVLKDLTGKFNRFRQSRIDEELFDVVSGFEALAHKER